MAKKTRFRLQQLPNRSRSYIWSVTDLFTSLVPAIEGVICTLQAQSGELTLTCSGSQQNSPRLQTNQVMFASVVSQCGVVVWCRSDHTRRLDPALNNNLCLVYGASTKTEKNHTQKKKKSLRFPVTLLVV